MIDIIIPVLNEEKILTEEARYYLNLKTQARIIFVDGGSTDQTVALAQKYGEVVASPSGRAIQKNRGAQTSKAEHLLFLHVDALINDQALNHVEQAKNGTYVIQLIKDIPQYRTSTMLIFE